MGVCGCDCVGGRALIAASKYMYVHVGVCVCVCVCVCVGGWVGGWV